MAWTVCKGALTALAMSVTALPAAAQVAPVPNVNDCTFIRDPIALRDCINLYEGQRLAPGPRTAAFQPRQIMDQALIDAAGPSPGSFAPARHRRTKRVARPLAVDSASAVRIQQVTPFQ